MSDDDRFLDALRRDARGLRYEADDAAMTRIAARVREGIAEENGVASLLALWFRPLAASLAAFALVAAIGIAVIDVPESSRDEELVISMAGDRYRVE